MPSVSSGPMASTLTIMPSSRVTETVIGPLKPLASPVSVTALALASASFTALITPSLVQVAPESTSTSALLFSTILMGISRSAGVPMPSVSSGPMASTLTILPSSRVTVTVMGPLKPLASPVSTIAPAPASASFTALITPSLVQVAPESTSTSALLLATILAGISVSAGVLMPSVSSSPKASTLTILPSSRVTVTVMGPLKPWASPVRVSAKTLNVPSVKAKHSRYDRIFLMVDTLLLTMFPMIHSKYSRNPKFRQRKAFGARCWGRREAAIIS